MNKNDEPIGESPSTETRHTPTLRLCALADGIDKMLDGLAGDVRLSPSAWAYVVHGETVVGIIRTVHTPIVQAVNNHAALVEALRGLMWRFEDDDSDPHAPAETAPDILNARALLSQLDGAK